MQDYEYMYEVCLCSVLEDRSPMETLSTGFKLTGPKREAVCVVFGVWSDIRLNRSITEGKPGITDNKITPFRIGWPTLVH